MEEQNNNSNNNQNNQYTFFNMKDDHGFNDNITSKVEDPKKTLTKRLIFIFAIIIVSIAVVLMFTNMLKGQKKTVTDNYNTIVEQRNRIYNQIRNLRD